MKTARLLKEYLHDTPAATLDPRQLGELTDLFKELRDFLESAETSAMLGLAATALSAMTEEERRLQLMLPREREFYLSYKTQHPDAPWGYFKAYQKMLQDEFEAGNQQSQGVNG